MEEREGPVDGMSPMETLLCSPLSDDQSARQWAESVMGKHEWDGFGKTVDCNMKRTRYSRNSDLMKSGVIEMNIDEKENVAASINGVIVAKSEANLKLPTPGCGPERENQSSCYGGGSTPETLRPCWPYPCYIEEDTTHLPDSDNVPRTPEHRTVMLAGGTETPIRMIPTASSWCQSPPVLSPTKHEFDAFKRTCKYRKLWLNQANKCIGNARRPPTPVRDPKPVRIPSDSPDEALPVLGPSGGL
eukprot:jgi/Botrbrau1/9143/Bobra.160_3s0016.1